MAKEGTLDRLSRGVYQNSDINDTTGEDAYKVATIRCGTPSAICLLSALEHYHVTDQIPGQVWIMVPESKRVISKQLKLLRCRDPQWNIGIQKTKNYWITSLERTLTDCLLYKRLIGHQVALDALKRAISEKKTKLGNIYDLSKKMGIAHRIQHIIEVLGS